MEFCGGHAGRLRDWEAVTRGEKERAIEDHLEKELKAIKKKCPELPMRDFLVATEFVKLFGEARWRRPILAIVGGTNLGKSVLAAKVLGDVASLVGVPSFLEVTVEGDLALDLSEFDVAKHAGVLLDGVGDAMMLKSHREVLQGRPKVCRGGKSATMMYSYPFTLCRRAVVTTMDLSAKNLHLLTTDHWLSNPDNVRVLRLSEPAWVATEPPAAAAASPMAQWSVSAVSSWLESLDMSGPAATLRAQGVSGADLLAFATPRDFAHDLGTTPFVAKKVLRLRDEHAREEL